jgi:hypothetical protein
MRQVQLCAVQQAELCEVGEPLQGVRKESEVWTPVGDVKDLQQGIVLSGWDHTSATHTRKMY